MGLGFVVVANAASTEISGFEVDAAWQATEKLRLNLAFGYIDGEYGSFPGAGCTAAAARCAYAASVVLTPDAPVTSVTVDGQDLRAEVPREWMSPSGQPLRISVALSSRQSAEFYGVLWRGVRSAHWRHGLVYAVGRQLH